MVPILLSETRKANRLIRNGHFDSELLSLGIGSRHQSHPGYTRWKTEVVFYPHRGPRLPAKCAAVEDQHRKSFRTRIDRSGETRGACANDHDVIHAFRIEPSHEPDATREFCFARVAQKLSIWAEHYWQLPGIDMETFH